VGERLLIGSEEESAYELEDEHLCLWDYLASEMKRRGLHVEATAAPRPRVTGAKRNVREPKKTPRLRRVSIECVNIGECFKRQSSKVYLPMYLGHACDDSVGFNRRKLMCHPYHPVPILEKSYLL
jgi:hypothetical protein